MTAQSVSAQHDVLIFVNGEKLIGQVVEATAKEVTFKSEMAGKVTAKWDKIKELRYGEPAAVVKKGVKLRWGEPFPNVPQGTVTAANGQVQVRPAPSAPPISVPVSNLQNLVTTEEFERAMHEHPSFFSDWKGAATAGASLVVATQNERTYTSNISLVRAMPTEGWLNPIRRTKVTFNSAYGILTQPGQLSVETSILHGEAQHDEYFSPSMFGFGDAAFDHNFAQGLDLQQTYGGGVGWTAIKSDSEELDVKGAMTYMRQQFQTAQANQNLIGSTFSESFSGKFIHGLTLQQDVAFLPAWNNTNAYSAVANLAVTLPFYKRFGITVGILDNFLNNPPPGFRKNSFTFTTGATYTIGPVTQ
ncbi:MAG: DUF481 domain-containing protein [Bryobacteraceae bacterium]